MALNANYVVRETTANLTRNITLTVASVLTVFVTLAIVGTAVLVRQGAENMTQEFKGGVEFIVYVDPGIKGSDLAEVKQNLDANPGVRKATYFDEAKTYNDFRKLFKGESVMLENVRPQDLPTSFRVEPKDASAQSVSELVDFYRNQPHVYQVRTALDVIREVTATTSRVNRGLTVFAVALLAASALLILNTVRTAMFARRREIEVMKLVGATNWFIRVPFLFEGLLQGLMGGGLAIVFLQFVVRPQINGLVGGSKSLTLLRTFTVDGSDVLLACVTVGAAALILSLLSSAIATRRFLDV